MTEHKRLYYKLLSWTGVFILGSLIWAGFISLMTLLYFYGPW